MRLVPDMTALGTLELLKDYLTKKGFGDIEVNMSGGYDPNQTSPDTKLIQAQVTTYKKLGQDPLIVAAFGRFMAGIHLHQRPSKPSGRTLRTGPRNRRARTQ